MNKKQIKNAIYNYNSNNCNLKEEFAKLNADNFLIGIKEVKCIDDGTPMIISTNREDEVIEIINVNKLRVYGKIGEKDSNTVYLNEDTEEELFICTPDGIQFYNYKNNDPYNL